MPKVSKEHRQARREQILEAALNCFARNGFHNTSMRDICKEAGLSAGAVYLHFRSKEKIMEAAFKMNQEIRAVRYEKAREADTATEAFRRLGDYFYNKLAEPVPDKAWQLWVQLVSEATRNPRVREDIRQGWDLFEKQMADLGRQGMERGELNGGLDFKIVGRLWAAVHDGLILQKIIDPKLNVRKYAEAFGTLIRDATSVASDKKNGRRRSDDG
jgi:AcrR family transcriptional regulator